MLDFYRAEPKNNIKIINKNEQNYVEIFIIDQDASILLFDYLHLFLNIY